MTEAAKRLQEIEKEKNIRKMEELKKQNLPPNEQHSASPERQTPKRIDPND
jgi:hypothetical protein